MSENKSSKLSDDEARFLIEKALQLQAQEGFSFACATEQVEREYRRITGLDACPATRPRQPDE